MVCFTKYNWKKNSEEPLAVLNVTIKKHNLRTDPFQILLTSNVSVVSGVEPWLAR